MKTSMQITKLIISGKDCNWQGRKKVGLIGELGKIILIKICQNNWQSRSAASLSSAMMG